jgi:hypothetical protein
MAEKLTACAPASGGTIATLLRRRSGAPAFAELDTKE